MIIIRGFHNLRDIKFPIVLTVGNFDGLHLGHKRIIECMKEKASEIGGRTMVLSFFPHPLKVLEPLTKLNRISSIKETASILSIWGIDYFLLVKFSSQFAKTIPEEFIEKFLYDKLHFKAIYLGQHHRFGYKNSGSIESLYKMQKKYDFTVHKVNEISIEGQRVSSSVIRKCIQDGKIEEANTYLGRPYTFSGRVVHGSGRGTKLGFPTANLLINDKIRPALGVYIAKIYINDKSYTGLANIGSRPTFKENDIAVEAYILNFSGNIYGKKIKIEFVKYLREEIAFNTPDDLVVKIKEDINIVYQWMEEKK